MFVLCFSLYLFLIISPFICRPFKPPLCFPFIYLSLRLFFFSNLIFPFISLSFFPSFQSPSIPVLSSSPFPIFLSLPPLHTHLFLPLSHLLSSFCRFPTSPPILSLLLFSVITVYLSFILHLHLSFFSPLVFPRSL